MDCRLCLQLFWFKLLGTAVLFLSQVGGSGLKKSQGFRDYTPNTCSGQRLETQPCPGARTGQAQRQQSLDTSLCLGLPGGKKKETGKFPEAENKKEEKEGEVEKEKEREKEEAREEGKRLGTKPRREKERVEAKAREAGGGNLRSGSLGGRDGSGSSGRRTRTKLP